jgi:hypothetical protein
MAKMYMLMIIWEVKLVFDSTTSNKKTGYNAKTTTKDGLRLIS